jgi:quercetin dioxygenase-like cupin family protein
VSYFDDADAETGTPVSLGYRTDLATGPQLAIGPGLRVEPVLGEQLLLSRVTWEEGAAAPAHAHAEEQIVLVLEGRVEMAWDGEAHVLEAGQACVLPPWTRHSARSLTSHSVTVEVFSPPRKALLAMAPEGSEILRPQRLRAGDEQG